jgi:hypothetical protein
MIYVWQASAQLHSSSFSSSLYDFLPSFCLSLSQRQASFSFKCAYHRVCIFKRKIIVTLIKLNRNCNRRRRARYKQKMQLVFVHSLTMHKFGHCASDPFLRALVFVSLFLSLPFSQLRRRTRVRF